VPIEADEVDPSVKARAKAEGFDTGETPRRTRNTA
jgi:hypothetical protein